MPKKSAEEKKPKSIEDRYKRKTDIEHVLTLPDTYIGSIVMNECNMYVLDEKTQKMVYKTIKIAPGLYKIFDEILVNARDHCIRTKGKCNVIKVNIDREKNSISVFNNGEGIPIQKHKIEKVYVPELIFGMLRSSENYDADEKRTVGGKNGFGAKLTNIFSKEFIVETVDATTKQKYVQTFTNNMSVIGVPEITKSKAKEEPYTKITFVPDLARFSTDKFTDDLVALFKKRVYDIAASTEADIYFNDVKLSVGSFSDYVDMFYETMEDRIKITENPNKRWKVCVVYPSNGGFEHVSYVNGVNTYDGGTHVDYVVKQIVDRVDTEIKKKYKNLIMKPQYIKDHITVFVDSVIDNPAFVSQTKDKLSTKVADFGSTCELSDKFIKQILETGIIDDAVRLAELKQMTTLKKSDGKKTRKIDVEKLEDATWAGTRKASKCTLILTEGDSAKAFAKSGRAVIGTERFGVFPLRGKLLNVRDAKVEKIARNEEIANLKIILGLKQNKVYKDVSELRYGSVLILTDQDVDGSHIKGLVMNFIHTFWPDLAKITGFIQSMYTPIVKAFKGTLSQARKNPKNLKIFYTYAEYMEWKATNPKGWKIKYYKGLGTSDAIEAKECFQDFENKRVYYIWEALNKADNNIEIPKLDDDLETETETETEDISKEEKEEDTKVTEATETEEEKNKVRSPSDNALLVAFDKNRVADRKKMLLAYDKNVKLDNIDKKVTYTDFVFKDLIHFSNYDNIRSIPNVIDGLKPSLRKILHAAYNEKLINHEEKVVELGAAVLKCAYHHGEVSLYQAIIGMAQNYAGTNNINILKPNGQFGTRSAGGSDAASPRYIFTQINSLCTKIFREEDLPILSYLDEDGKQIEPEYYIPIIPMLLVNGTIGIGTGYSTNVPAFNPVDIVSNLLLLMDGKELKPMTPWYRGFKGTIEKVNDTSFNVSGICKIENENTVRITEVPVQISFEKYVGDLKGDIATEDEERKKKKINIVVNESADQKGRKKKKQKANTRTKSKRDKIIESIEGVLGNSQLNITVSFVGDELKELIKKSKVEQTLRLVKPLSIANMNAYNHDIKLTKYNTPEDIIREFYTIRLDAYIKRKQYILNKLRNELELLKYRVLFIRKVIDKEILFVKVKMSVIVEKLEKFKFPKLSLTYTENDDSKSYDYLTKMHWTVFTEEKVKEHEDEYKLKTDEIDTLEKTTEIEIWKKELKEFLKEYKIWLEERNEEDSIEDTLKTTEKKKRKKKAVTKTETPENIKKVKKIETETIDLPKVTDKKDKKTESENEPNKKPKKLKKTESETEDKVKSKKLKKTDSETENKVKPKKLKKTDS